MGAKPAVAKIGHRCTKCGETDLTQFSMYPYSKSGLQYWCKACSRAYNRDWVKFTQGKPTKFKHKAPRMKFVTLICGVCEKEFKISEYQQRRRIAQKKKHGNDDPTLYCGKKCGSTAAHPLGVKNRKLKKRAWKSDDQNYWDQVLHDEGLGEHRGMNSLHMSYGLHTYIEGVDSDGSIKLVAKRHSELWEGK